MHLDPGDIEGLAIDTYRLAKLDPSVPVSASRLARILHGPEVITRGAPFAGARLASSGEFAGKVRIYVSRHLPLRRAHHAIGHELAHVIVRRTCSRIEELEAACDHLGAALMAPRPAASALHRAVGVDLARMADAMVATETCAALRLGEALGLPLVSFGARVRVRGPEAFEWPPVEVLSSWRRRPPRGLERVRVRDEPGRMVLVASA